MAWLLAVDQFDLSSPWCSAADLDHVTLSRVGVYILIYCVKQLPFPYISVLISRTLA